MKKLFAETFYTLVAVLLFVGLGGLVAPISVVAGFKIAENVFPDSFPCGACVESEAEPDAETPDAVAPETLVAE